MSEKAQTWEFLDTIGDGCTHDVDFPFEPGSLHILFARFCHSRVVVICRNFVISQEVRELFRFVLGHTVEDSRGVWGKASYDLENKLEAISCKTRRGRKMKTERERERVVTLRGGFLTNFKFQIRSIVAPSEHFTIRDSKNLHRVQGDLWRERKKKKTIICIGSTNLFPRGCRESNDRNLRELFLQERELAVVFAEVVSPGGHAVSFINNEPG